MFQLIQPIGMWLAAAAIIPVAIHLWNVKYKKVLLVGSVALLEESVAPRASRLRVAELLLLLLRCLLILLAALLLSQPRWQQPLIAADEKGWILLESSNIGETYNRFKTTIDSLTAKGYRFHYFNGGFRERDLKDALKDKRRNAAGDPDSYWQLLSQLNKKVPPSLPVYVFTTNGLNKFRGRRPAVAMNLHWTAYTAKDSIDEIIATAYVTGSDSGRIVVSRSRPYGTINDYTDVGMGNIPSNYKTVPFDTAVLLVTIYADKYGADATYVKAAIEAVRQFTKRQIVLTVAASAKAIPVKQDWLFWLSDEAIPDKYTAKNIFTYLPGKAVKTPSVINTGERMLNVPDIAVYQRIPYTGDDYKKETIWSDGAGNPILTLEKDSVNIFRFYTRFSPSWTDLAWSKVFPQYVLQLLLSNADSDNGVADKRIISDNQLQPGFLKNNAGNKEQLLTITDLTHYIWLLMFIVFGLERFISFKTRTKQYA